MERGEDTAWTHSGREAKNQPYLILNRTNDRIKVLCMGGLRAWELFIWSHVGSSPHNKAALTRVLGYAVEGEREKGVIKVVT